MINKIFNYIVTICLAIFILSTLSISLVFKSYFSQVNEERLKNKINYISTAVNHFGYNFLEEVDLKQKNMTKDRVFLIDSFGNLRFDNKSDVKVQSNIKSVSKNLFFSEDVISALENGYGKSVDKKSIFSQKTISLSKKLDSGGVLKISHTENSFLFWASKSGQVLFLISVIFGVLSSFMAYQFLLKSIDQLYKINLENISFTTLDKEYNPFLKKLKNYTNSIQQKVDQMSQKQLEFKVIMENMQEGFIILDKNLNILFFNSSVSKFFDNKEIKEQQNIMLLNRTKDFLQAIENSLKGISSETIVKSKKNIYNIIANPILVDGNTFGTLIFILDITEKINRENLRREFTANVSHELKTPLTTISGFAEIMKNGIANQEDIIRFSTLIFNETQHLINMINNLIKLSQLDEGSLFKEMTSLNLKPIVENTISNLAYTAEKRNIKTNFTGEDAYILGIQQVIEEIVYNLYENAIKYNKDNGEINIIIENLDNKILLCIKDTGIGIPSNEMNRIYERFYKIDKSRNSAVEGTGLGLAIVKRGLALHNADILLTSTEGEGSEFKIYFNSLKLS